MIRSILLIRPNANGKVEIPLGLLYVGTALRKKGYKVQIIDLHANPEKEKEIENILIRDKDIFLGISSLSISYFWIKNFTLEIKRKFPDLPIIIGGHIAPIYDLLLNKTGIDYVCLGEGEEIFPELIEKINNGKPIDDVLGIAFKKEENVIKNSPRSFMQSFCIPDYSLINIQNYLTNPARDRFFKKDSIYQSVSKPDDKLSMIMFSRGCTGGCYFCYRHLPGFRQVPVDLSWQHLMFLYDNYGVKYFRIEDELFTNNPDWFKDFYHKVIESKIDILFRITGLRVDLITDEQLKMLKEMGCIAINYGLESGSQKILNKMNKGTTVGQNLSAVKKTLAHGMQAMAYIMLGYEGETKETLKETLDMLIDSGLGPESLAIYFTVPLPGTRLYSSCLEKKLIKDEEKFLENLYYKEDQYPVQLGDLNFNELIGFEKKMVFLLILRQIIDKNGFFFKIIKRIVLLIPYDSRLNQFLLLIRKLKKKDDL